MQRGGRSGGEEGAEPEQSPDLGSLVSGRNFPGRCCTVEKVQVGCRPGRLPRGGVGSAGPELGGLEPYSSEINVQTKYGQLIVLFPASLSRMGSQERGGWPFPSQ